MGTKKRNRPNQINRSRLLICSKSSPLKPHWLLPFIFTISLFICLSQASVPYYLPYSSSSLQTDQYGYLKSSRYHHHSQEHNSQDQSIVSSYNFLISNKLRNSQQQLTKQQTNFTHLVFDARTDQLYIGATNYLLKFDSNLRLLQKQRTGPVDDSPQCSPTDCFSVDSKEIKPTNNFNKILLLDSVQRQLIFCGSAKQGACYQLPLDDSSDKQHHNVNSELVLNDANLIRVPVAANDENSSSVAFIGPANYGHEKSRVMYVAVTNTKLGQYRELVPAISARFLTTNNQDTFRIIESSFTDSARVDISSHLRDYYLVHYVYGFYYHDQIYFAQVQKRSHLRTQEELGFHTRLSRVCASDAGFKSYTEITLECQFESEGRTINYNVLKAATFSKVGSNLADGLASKSSIGTSGSAANNDVFVGVFSQSKDHSTRQGDHSAVCAFSMNDIKRRFKENIHLCYNGSVRSRNMDYIGGSINECPEVGKAGNILNFCEETVKLNGSIPLHGVPLYKIDGTELTAIAVNTAQNLLSTVAFLGSSNGKLLKVLLKPELSESRLFEIVNVDTTNSEPVLSDLLFDSKQKHVYVATSKKVVKVLIERCPQQSNCTECINLNNPYCGWCSLEKRCSTKSDCITRADYNSIIQDTRTAFSTPRWLPMESAQCINFEKITPNFIPIDKRQNVHLTIHQLPILPYGSSYSCVFNDKIVTPANLVSNGLTCPTPELSERPIIDGTDHVTMRLAVKAGTSTPFIQRTFAFFDCNVHKTCRSCVHAEFACTWCKLDNMCVSNQSSCDARMAIFSEHSINYNAEKGSKYCPSFKVDNEIIIPNGVSKEISLKVQNLNNEQDGFQCMMEIEGAREIVKASIQNGQLVCLKNLYTYLAEIAQHRAQLTVLRNGDAFIDRTNVTLYKCELMGSNNGKSDCSLCQSSASRFQCAFCAGRCSFKEECGIEEPTICPPPRIDLVYPLSGPIEGGTILTIEGSNLGSSIDQLRNKISIGSATCEPIQVIASVRVICKTQPPEPQDQQFHSSKVVVANSAGLTFSQEKFHFKKIELNQVSPNIGPQSGGTLLYLNGENFNIGSNVQVYLDEIKCDVDKQVLSNKQLVCRTRPSNKPRPIQKLTLIIDNANLTISKPFLYTENPTIKRISPDQSYLSGGRILNVLGERFLSIQTPKMGVYYRKQLINETYCTIVNNTLMLCPTPSVKEFTRNFRLINGGLSSSLATSFDNNQIDDLDFMSTANNNQSVSSHQLKQSEDNQISSLRTSEPKRTLLKLKISFGLDNSLRNLPLIGEQTTSALSEQQASKLDSKSFTSNNLDQDEQQDEEDEQKNYFAISYVSDPKVYKLDQTASSFNGHSLVIQGENLNYAVSANELNVTIAGAPCGLTSLTENQLVCSAIIDRSSYKRRYFKDKIVEKSNSNLLSSLLSISQGSPEEQKMKPFPVIVRFSENLEFHLGYLTSDDSIHFRKLNHKKDGQADDFDLESESGSGGNEGFFSREHSEKIGQKVLIKGGVISGVLLIIFCLILLISFKRKSNEVEKQYKAMQLMMMDSLENSVRLECKQAFAELQTDLTEVNNLNQDFNAALLPSIKYISNIFFPGLGLNPLSSDYKIHNGQMFYNNSSNNAQLLEELLFSKHFLLTFIDVLEQQPSFTLRDRVNVASLLMIILIEKMDYSFCILEELLLKSIGNYAKSKFPQLFLRRTEFIVEKLLVNFLAITMEQSLAEESGNKLFLLCNAIKSQVEKGPIDYYTHEARYTLAEERLLKQQIEFNVINLIVFKVHTGLNEKSEYQVRVLDCDCISQVKNKILDVVYKNVPRSRRPESSNVVLEHNYMLNQTYSLKRNGTSNNNTSLVPFQLTKQPIYGQSIILEDDDDTTQTDSNGWRQINTVKHYQLMDNSIVTMRVLNEPLLDAESLHDQSQLNYTIYDNYTDSGTGHLYECIAQDHHNSAQPPTTTELLIKPQIRSYFDQQPSFNTNKYSSQNLPDMLDIPQSGGQERKQLNSIYGYSTASTIMSNRLLKQNQQQQMPLLGNAATSNRKLKNVFTPSSYNVYYTLNGKKPFGTSSTLMRNDSLTTTSTTIDHQTIRHYHLSKDLDQSDSNSSCSTASSTLRKAIKNRTDDLTQNKKLIKEIYLTRLLTTKGTLEKYIDDFFSSVLVCNNNTPTVVKWLFDLLDDAIEMHGIEDPEIIYAWKSNSLPLRFWVNLLKNPNFLFDLEKTPELDYNLNVIAQAFLDSCSLDHQVLNKESHSAKLLFARDIPRYREMVRKYYEDIQCLPKVRDDLMLTELKNCSKKYVNQVDRSNALNELLVYTTRYREVLLSTFYNDPSAYYSKLQLMLESIYSKS